MSLAQVVISMLEAVLGSYYAIGTITGPDLETLVMHIITVNRGTLGILERYLLELDLDSYEVTVDASQAKEGLEWIGITADSSAEEIYRFGEAMFANLCIRALNALGETLEDPDVLVIEEDADEDTSTGTV